MVNEAISIVIKLRVWKIFKEFKKVRSQQHNKLRDFNLQTLFIDNSILSKLKLGEIAKTSPFFFSCSPLTKGKLWMLFYFLNTGLIRNLSFFHIQQLSCEVVTFRDACFSALRYKFMTKCNALPK